MTISKNLTSDDARQKQMELIDKLFDCDKTNLVQIEELLAEILMLVEYYTKTSQNAYLVVDQEKEENDLQNNQEEALIEALSPKGLSTFQKHVSPFLVSLLRKPPKNIPDECEWVDKISNITALVCGRIATGEGITTFEFSNAGSLTVRETSFTDAEIGFQTWGAGILLAKMIDQRKIEVQGQNILELGSGTGLAGLVSGRMGGKTIMTDYHPVVIENALKNIERNGLQDCIDCLELDWRWFEEGNENELQTKENALLNHSWKTIIAADCVFDLSHSRLVPKVAKHYLSKALESRFYVLLPHRLQFRKEILGFEENMAKEGWIMEYNQWIEKHSLTLRYYIFKLDEQSS